MGTKKNLFIPKKKIRQNYNIYATGLLTTYSPLFIQNYSTTNLTASSSSSSSSSNNYKSIDP
jgi:hypothetical protein